MRAASFVRLAAAVLAGTGFSIAASAATISIVNNDGPGEGFNDATPVAALPNNPGTTIGQQRLNVFIAAANQWGAVLNSPVTILVRAQFNPQACDATGAVLGSAGPLTASRDFANAPVAGTWFVIAEANALAGSDLSAANPDINATFNVSLDTGCLPGTSGWWYGLDASVPVPADRIALMPVVFHEIAHGLGFLSLTNSSTGQLFGTPGRPDIWAHFLKDANLGAGTLWRDMSNGQRQASAIDDPNLIWDGANVTARGSSYLEPPAALIIASPAAIAGTYAAQPASYGLQPPLAGVSGNVVEGLDGGGPGTATDGCEALTNAAQVAGNIALLDRGTCNFTVKTANAQAAGATAVIVANNVAAGLPGMGGTDPSIVISSYGVSQATGDAIRANLGGGVVAELGYDFARLSGTTNGSVRMYAPNPLEPGSSVSHFTVDAIPNLLMEPAINDSLFSDVDLTVALFNDIFWPLNPRANGAPTISAAAEFLADAGVPSPLTEILFSDPDSGNGNLTLTFAVADGTIDLVDQPGIVEAGSGTASATATGPRQPLLQYVTAGNARYLSAPGCDGSDTLDLTVSDNGNTGTGGALTDTANATITIAGCSANAAPVAQDDSDATSEDTALVVGAPGVLDNDTDADLDALTAAKVTDPGNGTVVVQSSGAYTYTPTPDFCGADSFTYRANDGAADSNTATVSINVTCQDDAAVANDDTGISIAEDTATATAIDVLANDTDVENDAFFVTAVSSATGGTAAVGAGGSDATFIPSADFCGAAGFTYEITGGDTATVSIDVTCQNDAAVANDDTGISIAEDTATATAIDVLANDTDVENDAFFVTAVSSATGGTAAVGAGGSDATFIPSADFCGAAGFTYEITGGDTATVSIDVACVNDAPSFTTLGNQTVGEDAGAQTVAGFATGSAGPANESGQLLTYGVSNDNAALFAVAPAVNAAGILTYTPADDANGSATITIDLHDDGGTANGGDDTADAQAFTITVTPVDDGDAVASGDAANALEDAAAPIAIDVLDNDTADPDDGSLAVTAVTDAANGTTAFDAAGVTYLPDANFCGTDGFSYTVNGVSSADVSVTVTCVNDAPSFTKGADQTVDADSGAASIANWASAISAGPANESTQTVAFELSNDNLTLFAAQPAVDAAGTLTFTPAAGQFGVANVTILARDSGGTANGGVEASASQSFTITVDEPAGDTLANADDDTATVAEDSAATTIDVLANDEDADSDPFEVTQVTQGANGTAAVGTNGANVTFTPAANFCGSTSFGYAITGGDTATVSVTVTCVNDAPVAADGTASVEASSAVGTAVATVAASDIDGPALSYAITGGNTDGAFAIDATTGAITVAVPGAVEVSSSPFALVVTVSDGTASDTATITVTVTPANDAIFSNGYE